MCESEPLGFCKHTDEILKGQIEPVQNPSMHGKKDFNRKELLGKDCFHGHKYFYL